MKNPFPRQIVQTEDGSSSIFLPDLNEHYHSVHGAIQESEHVFIRHGFDLVCEKSDQIKLLEVGLGTGLNCLLTLRASMRLEKMVSYTGLEPYPLSQEEWESLNYPQVINGIDIMEPYRMLHTSEYGMDVKLSSRFTLNKLEQTIEAVDLPDDCYHLVYFDAFGPQVQPELWNVEVFEKVAQSMRAGGVLVTYSAKGIVKRALKACGFMLEHPAGPPGKREMTRAVKVV